MILNPIAVVNFESDMYGIQKGKTRIMENAGDISCCYRQKVARSKGFTLVEKV